MRGGVAGNRWVDFAQMCRLRWKAGKVAKSPPLLNFWERTLQSFRSLADPPREPRHRLTAESTLQIHTANYTLQNAHFRMHTAEFTLQISHCEMHTASCTQLHTQQNPNIERETAVDS